MPVLPLRSQDVDAAEVVTRAGSNDLTTDMSHTYRGLESFVLDKLFRLKIFVGALLSYLSGCQYLTDNAETLELESQQPSLPVEESEEIRVAAFLIFTTYFFSVFVFLEGLLIFWFKFPRWGKKRPPCTTMPWTIPPALAVLWGVCWMFWPPLHHSVPGQFTYNPRASDPSRNGVNAASEFDDIDISQISTRDIDFSEYDLTPQIFDNLGYTDWTDTVSDMMLLNELTANTRADNPFDALIGRSSNIEAHAATPPRMSHNLEQNKGISSIPLRSNNADEIRESIKPITETPTFTMDVSSATKKFTCLDCGEGFTRTSTLQRHQSEKHSDNPEIFPCPNTGCRRSDTQNAFKRAAHLTRHLKSCKKRPEGQKSSQASSSEHHLGCQTDSRLASTIIYEHKEAGNKRKATDEADPSTQTSEQVIAFLRKRRRQLLAEAEAGEKKAKAQREEATKLAECIRSLEGDSGDGAGI